MPAPNLVWRGAIDGAGFQNSGALLNAAVHGVRCAISGADVAGFHRLEGAQVTGDGIWWPANAGLSKQDHNNTQSIHGSSSVSGLVFAMTGRGNGDILRSTDHGKSWAIAGGINVSGNGETAGTGAYRRTGRMFADSGAYVWAAGFTGTSTDAGASIARSTDNGATFAAWGLTGRQFRSIVVDPQDGTILYGAQETGTSPGLIKMTNCKAAGGTAPTVTQLTGAGAAQGATLTSLRDVVAVVEGTKTWVYFISHVGTTSRIWKFNATDSTGLVDITGTLSTTSLWTTLDCVRNAGNTATTVWLGCWQARTNVGSNQAEALVKSADGGTTWQVNVTWAGTSFNLPTGQAWWRSAQSGQRTWVISGNTFDSNCVRIEPGQPSVVYVFGRAGVWRTTDNGATWFPLMEDLLVSMSHGMAPHSGNPAQAANLNVDWGVLYTNSNFQDVVAEYSPNNAFGGVYNERGLIVGFGSRSDNIGPFGPGRQGTQGSIKSTTTASAGQAATWIDQGWAAAHPTAADPVRDVPRCLGVTEDVLADGRRVLLAIAQGQKTGTTEIDRGGIYRKLIPVGSANGGTWSLVGGPIAFNGWGVNNTLEAHFYWPSGSQYVFAYDRQSGLWRSQDYGATWARVSTLTSTATWSGFIAGAGSVVWLATSTTLYRFANALVGATLTPVTLPLPTRLTRPGPIAWDEARAGLAITQRVGNTPVGLWWADDAATAAAPTWTEVGDDRYKSAAIYTQGMEIGPTGVYYINGWGNAAIIGEETIVVPPPTGFSVDEKWETSALGSTPSSPPSAFTGTGRARITDLNPYEGVHQVEFDPVAQTGFIDTPVFGPAANVAVDVILDLQTLPSVNTRFISGRLGTVAQSGVQLTTTGGLVLQDVNASRDTAGPVLTVPGRYRVAAMFDSVTDVCRLRVWTGADLSVATPTYDSGEKAYTTGGNTEVVRLGAVAAVTWLARMDAVLVKTDGTWPVRPPSGGGGGGGGVASATRVGFIPMGITGAGPAITKPTRLVSGLGARRIDQITTATLPLLQAGAGGFAALNLYWYDHATDPTLKSLQTTPGQLNEAGVLAFVADLDYCWARNLPVLLRLQGGYWCPPFARAAGGGTSSGGGMPFYWNDGGWAGPLAPSDPTFRLLPLPMPLVWTAGFGQANDEMMQLLAGEDRIMGHPAMCGVTVSGNMFYFAETLTRKFVLLENRQAATAANWSDTLDRAAFTRAFQLHAQLFNSRGLGSHMSMTTKEGINAQGARTVSEVEANVIMNEFVTTLGGFGVVASNNANFPDIANPAIETEMRVLRDRSTPYPVPNHFQTRTLGDLKADWDVQALGAKQTTPHAVADAYMTRRSSAIEMPGGWEEASVVLSTDHVPPLATAPVGTTRWPAFTLLQAADINNRGATNTVGLDLFH